MKKIVLVVFSVLLLVAIATSAGAVVEKTDHERIDDLEKRVDACGCSISQTPDLKLPVGLQGTPGSPSATVNPSVTVEPTSNPTSAPVEPTSKPPTEPTAPSDPEPTKKPHKPPCNQGNSPEGCDPGNSNNTNPSNDEGPCNRGRSGKCK